jgi:hypothetical protein
MQTSSQKIQIKEDNIFHLKVGHDDKVLGKWKFSCTTDKSETRTDSWGKLVIGKALTLIQ